MNIRIGSTMTKTTRRNMSSETIISFKNVEYEYVYDRPILDDVSFGIQEGSKVTIMGQNGAGKSTILKLINGMLRPSEGKISIKNGYAVATALQVMPRDCYDLTVLEFFTRQMHGNSSGIHSSIAAVLQVVELVAPNERLIRSFSGGQQARLLLASALIVNPDIILLDEPTNNLDVAGLEMLTGIILGTLKTVVVISHDEEFLNSFTDSVLYLDQYFKKVEKYDGNYHVVKSEISKRIRKENQLNARLATEASAKKAQAGVFANKGGGMRKVAQKMREEAKVLEGQTVSVRKEDVALKPFIVPFQSAAMTSQGGLIGSAIVVIDGVALPARGGEMTPLKTGALSLMRGSHLRLVGPNGIGKTTLLEHMSRGQAAGVYIHPKATIGYYRQDFNNLDLESTVLECLEEAGGNRHSEQELRSTAAVFLLRGEMTRQLVGTLSEGQKGLVALCCLVLKAPGVLVMDEPTNHINFRHLPALAQALASFQGTLILVTHDHEFAAQVGCEHTLDLGKL